MGGRGEFAQPPACAGQVEGPGLEQGGGRDQQGVAGPDGVGVCRDGLALLLRAEAESLCVAGPGLEGVESDDGDFQLFLCRHRLHASVSGLRAIPLEGAQGVMGVVVSV